MTAFKAYIEKAQKLAAKIEKILARPARTDEEKAARQEKLTPLQQEMAALGEMPPLPKNAAKEKTDPAYQAKNQLALLKEYLAKQPDTTATARMQPIAETLPANFAGADQTGPARSSIQARQNAMPNDVTANVDFIGANHTDIAAHIASKYPNIPPVLADTLTARIVYERKARRVDEGAPLPRPEDPEDSKSEFHIYQQVEFQEGWSDKLFAIEALFDGSGNDEAAQATVRLNQLERKIKELRERGSRMIRDLTEWVKPENAAWNASVTPISTEFVTCSIINLQTVVGKVFALQQHASFPGGQQEALKKTGSSTHRVF